MEVTKSKVDLEALPFSSYKELLGLIPVELDDLELNELPRDTKDLPEHTAIAYAKQCNGNRRQAFANLYAGMKWMTLEEVQNICGVSQKTVQRWIDKKHPDRLPAHKIKLNGSRPRNYVGAWHLAAFIRRTDPFDNLSKGNRLSDTQRSTVIKIYKTLRAESPFDSYDAICGQISDQIGCTRETARKVIMEFVEANPEYAKKGANLYRRNSLDKPFDPTTKRSNHCAMQPAENATECAGSKSNTPSVQTANSTVAVGKNDNGQKAEQTSESETWTGDPFDVYKQEIGRDPLLTRTQEIRLARKTETYRKRYRHSILRTDFMLGEAKEILDDVDKGDRGVYGTLVVPKGDKVEQNRIRKIVKRNLVTIRELLNRNQTDFQTAVSTSQDADTRKAAWQSLARRRNRAVRLIEESPIREELLKPLFEQFVEMSEKMDSLRTKISRASNEKKKRNHRSELHRLMQSTCESRKTSKRCIQKAANVKNEYVDAKRSLSSRNLRLAYSIAKRYIGFGVDFEDLIGEGNFALARTPDTYDYRVSKFGTYATWLVRQAVYRATIDQSSTIRITVNASDDIEIIRHAVEFLLKELGREPDPEEIEELVDMPIDRIKKFLKILSSSTVSLDYEMRSKNNGEKTAFKDIVEDHREEMPDEQAHKSMLSSRVEEIMGMLDDEEHTVLTLRYGLDGKGERTLREIGEAIGKCRERANQIIQEAINKLRIPKHSRLLAAFYNEDCDPESLIEVIQQTSPDSYMELLEPTYKHLATEKELCEILGIQRQSVKKIGSRLVKRVFSEKFQENIIQIFLTVVESEFTLFQMQVEHVLVNAFQLVQTDFRKAPECFDAVDV